jgi:predicted phosphodiesterase
MLCTRERVSAMKILHLSDLYLNNAWFAWASAAADQYDLVCVAGDLLDMFSKKPPLHGMLLVKEWADSFPGKLALCSGNHDGNGPEMTPPAHLLTELAAEDRLRAEHLMTHERWMDGLGRADLVPDGRSELLPCGKRGVVLTTIPYDTLIAGHAVALGAILITSNTREFSRVRGLKLENWMAR